MALPRLPSSQGTSSLVALHRPLLERYACYRCPSCLRRNAISNPLPLRRRPAVRHFTSHPAGGRRDEKKEAPREDFWKRDPSKVAEKPEKSEEGVGKDVETTTDSSNQSMPPGWEDDPDWNISSFSQLPHRQFGWNQHMKVNENFKEALRQVFWQFRAPIRYGFAYGSGVFPQSSPAKGGGRSPHPNPPEAVTKWQDGNPKIIDFIFGVTYTQHWHSLNLHQHRDHYSALGSLGSGLVSHVQDSFGAGVYFHPYITVNGMTIKYGVVNLDTLARDLYEWDTLYLAGRLQKPVKILRDDPRMRLANQINLMSAVRVALLMQPEKFTEKDLFTSIAGLSYMGDPRMSSLLASENPNKVSNIVKYQLPNFRQLYSPFVQDLPNVTWTDARVTTSDDYVNKRPGWVDDVRWDDTPITMQQDPDPVKRGNMVRRLPKAFRQKLYFLYQKKFQIPGNEFNKLMEQSKDEDAGGAFKRREGGEFDRRIAQEPDLRDMVAKAIRQTVQWPSMTQSVKSVVTAGIPRSLRYLREKREKGRMK